MPRRRRRRARVRDPLRPYSEQEINRQANLLLEAGLAGPRGEITRAQAEARRQAQEDAASIAGFASALAKLTGSSTLGSEQIASSGRQGAFAEGLANAQRQAEAQQASKANEILGRQGGGSIQNNSLAGVTGYSGGLDAASIGIEGGSLRDYAKLLPGVMGGRGQLQQAERFREGEEEQEKFRGMMSELMAQSPAKRQEILQAIRANEIQKEAARTQRSYLGLGQQKEAFDQSLDTARLSETAAYHNATIAQRRESAAAKKKGTGAKAQAKARNARLSALDSNRARSFSFADSLYKGTPVKIGGVPTGEIRRDNAQQAYNKLWARFGQPLLRFAPPGNKKWWRGQIDAMLWNVLGSVSDGTWVKPSPGRGPRGPEPGTGPR